jgi:tRNA pseudouridine55 synthase
LTSADVRNVAEGFVGEIEQTPPAYSAIQISGKRAHELARQGKSPVIPSRRVTIHALEWLGMNVPEASQLPEFSLRMVCSTGTYVRTLGNDIAKRLGTECVMTELVRTRVGPFALEDAISLDAVESSPSAVRLEPAWRGVLQIPLWSVGEPVLRRLLDGQRLTHEELRPELVHGEESRFRDPKDDSRAAILDRNHLLRAIVWRRPEGTWHCEKGIAHWDVVPFS